MSTHPKAPASSFLIDHLQQTWADLNRRYFCGALPPIEIIWSTRLTASAGMFVCRTGRRRPDTAASVVKRLIRLSVPILQGDSQQAGQELIGTLAHEMIHQWQFDLLKRRPNHGPDFCRKMEEMNRDGLGITIRHGFAEAVQAFVRYAWRCQQCGKVYERQRRTIRPGRHHCGACLGALREVRPAPAGRRPTAYRPTAVARQMDLPFTFHEKT